MFSKILEMMFPEPKDVPVTINKYPAPTLGQVMLGILEGLARSPKMADKRIQFHHNWSNETTTAYEPINKKEVEELSKTILRALKKQGIGLEELSSGLVFLDPGEVFELKLGRSFLSPKR